MAEEKDAKAVKIKKKKWVQIISPALFRNELLGEVPVSEPKSLLGRSISINLMALTRDIKKQNTQVRFVITAINGDTASTEFYGCYLNSSSIKRMVRKGKERIGLSIACKTADNKVIRVMPLIIPSTKVKGSVATSFRRESLNYFVPYVAKTAFDDIMKDLITGKIHRDLKAILKKVYPVRILEIAKLHLDKEKKPLEATIEVKREVEEEEVEEEKPKKEEKAAEEKSEEVSAVEQEETAEE